MIKYKDIISVGTTFNKRIYDSEYQKIFADMRDNYPYLNFYVYHENSFELSKNNQKIDFTGEERDNLHLLDVFKVNEDWLEDFLKTSPLKDCHTMGNSGVVDSHYFNRNAIYWFRKIAAVKHIIEQVDTKYLLWLGADTYFRTDKGHPNGLDEEFFDYVSKFDCSVVKRPGQAIESDVIVFNFEKNGKKIAEEWVDYFLSMKAFKEKRWDDGYILTKVVEQMEKQDYSFGSLRWEFKNNVYRYIRHYKGPLKDIRDKKRGI